MQVLISPPCAPYDRDENAGKFLLQNGELVDTLFVVATDWEFYDVDRDVHLKFSDDGLTEAVWLYAVKTTKRFQKLQQVYQEHNELPPGFEQEFFPKRKYSKTGDLVFILELIDRGIRFDLQATPHHCKE